MTSKSLLNLTLDEIIQRQRRQGSSQVHNVKSKRKGGIIGMNQSRNFQKNNLSLSLSSRLSRGGGIGFKKINVDLRRSITIQNRLGSSSENQRMSVHNRLTLNKRSEKPLLRSPISIQNRPLSKRRNLKTKNSEDSQPVRITNGAIVKGLRSDQLLLQKLNQRRNLNLQAKMEKLRALQMKNWKSQIAERNERRESRQYLSKVSMNFDRGLTVSIANEVAKRAKTSTRAKRYATPTSSSSEESYPIPRTTRRFAEEVKELPSAPSLLRLGIERPPPPKPHRQVLDPQIQKEIAALQGFTEPHSGGPGPGVKGFKMVPSRTRHTLNERFTIEKNVLE